MRQERWIGTSLTQITRRQLNATFLVTGNPISLFVHEALFIQREFQIFQEKPKQNLRFTVR